MSDERLKPPVHFKNEQWAVTGYGVESVPPEVDYHFDASRISELTHKGPSQFYWPVHMAEKTWVDIEAFIEAFNQAIAIHAGRYSPAIDPTLLATSLSEARRIAASR